MSSNDETRQNASDPNRIRSLPELLETYQRWNSRDVMDWARRRAEALGYEDMASSAGRVVDDEQAAGGPSALEALEAQHELAEQLAGWRYITIRAAREAGASWEDITRAMRQVDEAAVRDEYLFAVGRQADLAKEIDTGFETGRYLAAAGDWWEELRPGTPPEAVEQIEQALARDDTTALDQLQRIWWDPTRSATAADAADQSEADPVTEDTSTDTGLGEGSGRAAPPDPWAPSDDGPRGNDGSRVQTDRERGWSSDGVTPVPGWDEHGVFEVYDPLTGGVHRDLSEAQYLQLAADRTPAGLSGRGDTDTGAWTGDDIPPPGDPRRREQLLDMLAAGNAAAAVHGLEPRTVGADATEDEIERAAEGAFGAVRQVQDAAEQQAFEQAVARRADGLTREGAARILAEDQRWEHQPSMDDDEGVTAAERVARANGWDLAALRAEGHWLRENDPDTGAPTPVGDLLEGEGWQHGPDAATWSPSTSSQRDAAVLADHLSDHQANENAVGGSTDHESLIGQVPAPRTALGEALDQTPAAELLQRAERADNVTYAGDLAAKEWAYRELEAVGGEAARRAALTGAEPDRALSDYVELLCEDPGVERFAEYTERHRAVHQALGVDSVPPDTDTAATNDTDTAAVGDGVSGAVASPAGEHDRRPGETRELAAARARHEHDAQLGRGEWGLSDHDRDRLVDALDPAGAAERDRLREAIDPATSAHRFAQLEAAALAEPTAPAAPVQGPAYNPAAEFGDPDYREPGSDAEANARLDRIAAWQQRTPEDEAWRERITELMGEPDPVADAAEVAARIERDEGPDSPAARAAWAEHGRRLDAATDDLGWELGEDAAHWSATDAAPPDDGDDRLVVGTIVLPGGLPPEETTEQEPVADEVWRDHRPAPGMAAWREFDGPAANDAGGDGHDLEPVAPPEPARSIFRAAATDPARHSPDAGDRSDDPTELQRRLERAREAVRTRDAGHAREPGGDTDAEDDPAGRREQLTRWHTDDHAAEASEATDDAVSADTDADGWSR